MEYSTHWSNAPNMFMSRLESQNKYGTVPMVAQFNCW